MCRERASTCSAGAAQSGLRMTTTSMAQAHTHTHTKLSGQRKGTKIRRCKSPYLQPGLMLFPRGNSTIMVHVWAPNLKAWMWPPLKCPSIYSKGTLCVSCVSALLGAEAELLRATPQPRCRTAQRPGSPWLPDYRGTLKTHPQNPVHLRTFKGYADLRAIKS